MIKLLLSLFVAFTLTSSTAQYGTMLNLVQGRWKVTNKCTEFTCTDTEPGDAYVGRVTNEVWTITQTPDMDLTLQSTNPGIGTIRGAEFHRPTNTLSFTKRPLLGADQTIVIGFSQGKLIGKRIAYRPECKGVFTLTGVK